MNIIALGLFAVLAGISALHLYWAFGGLWPASSAAELAQTVIGNDGANGMPGRALTILVALLIFMAAAWPVLHLAEVLPEILSRSGLWALVLVFLGRGIVTYALPNMAAQMSEPFARLNSLYYSPLCLLLGAGFLVLALKP